MFPSGQPPHTQPRLNPAILAALASLMNSSRTMIPGHLPEQSAPGLSPLAQAAAGNDPAGGYMPPPDQIGQVAAGTVPQQQLQTMLAQFRQQHRGVGLA